MYHLNWNLENEGFPEVEMSDNLQHLLIRLQQLANKSQSIEFVADIYFDNQNDDGKIYEVCHFNVSKGFIFSETPVPPPSGNPIPYWRRVGTL